MGRPPQVCKDHNGELTAAKEDAKTPEEEKQAYEDSRARQRAFLRRRLALRGGKRGAKKSWRPPKRHGRASRKVVETIDFQLETGGINKGLSQCIDVDWDTAHWSKWPLGGISLDQESSNLRAGNHLQYDKENKGHFDIDHDPAHGAWNDCQGAADDAGVLATMMVMLLIWNLPTDRGRMTSAALSASSIWRSFLVPRMTVCRRCLRHVLTRL